MCLIATVIIVFSQDSIEWFVGHATFKNPKEVIVGDQVLTADHILIATGTKPILPNTTDVPG